MVGLAIREHAPQDPEAAVRLEISNDKRNVLATMIYSLENATAISDPSERIAHRDRLRTPRERVATA